MYIYIYVCMYAGCGQHILQKADSSLLEPPADICLQHKEYACL